MEGSERVSSAIIEPQTANQETANQAPRQRSGILINRNFARLAVGQISTLGDVMFTTTLVVWVGVVLGRGQPWAPLAVSGVMLASAVPMALVGPFAGVFVDRWDKRRTMLRMDALRGALMVVLALLIAPLALPALPWWPGLAGLSTGGLPVVWRLGAAYAVIGLVSCADQFFRPAAVALIGDIVAEPDRPRAMGVIQAWISLSLLIGPPIAAPLALGLGAQWAILFDALTFAVSFVMLRAIHAPPAARSGAGARGHGFLREFGQGIRFLLGQRALRALVVTALIAMLGAGALTALDIFFVTGNLHAPAAFYGIIEGAQGLGTIVGALAASLLVRRTGLARAISWSVVALGLIVIAYARLTSFIPAVLLTGVSGIFMAVIGVSTAPLLLKDTPRELVGRVASLLDPVITMAAVAGTALAGYLDSVVLRGFHLSILGVAVGPVDTIFTAAGALVLLGGIYGLIWLREPEDAESAGAQPEIAA
jgi:predicted MFS family arabinose efflux permease